MVSHPGVWRNQHSGRTKTHSSRATRDRIHGPGVSSDRAADPGSPSMNAFSCDHCAGYARPRVAHHRDGSALITGFPDRCRMVEANGQRPIAKRPHIEHQKPSRKTALHLLRSYPPPCDCPGEGSPVLDVDPGCGPPDAGDIAAVAGAHGGRSSETAMCHGGPGLPTVGFAVAALIAENV